MSSSQRLLIIDREKSIAYTLGLIFSAEGFQVRTADAGEAGLKIAETWQPNLTIAGMIFAGMNGVEYARQLVIRYPDCRVILTSAQVGQDLIEDAKSSGFDFFHNPVAPPILINRVKSLLAETGNR